MDRQKLATLTEPRITPAEAPARLEALQAECSGPPFGHAMYGTIDWYPFKSIPGQKDFLKVLCFNQGVRQEDLTKHPTVPLMLVIMAERQRQCFLARSNTSSSSSASQPADPMCLLKAAADKIKRLIADTPDETPSASSSSVAASGSDAGAPQPGMSAGPNFPRSAIQYLAKLTEVNAQNSQLPGVRRKLVKIVTEMTEEAETAQLDLTPYSEQFAPYVFIFWCIATFRDNKAAEAFRDLEVQVNPMAPFADEAENQIDQDLMQIESGMLCKGPLRQRLKEYKVTLARGYDFMKKYEQRIQQCFSARCGRKQSYVPGDDIGGDALRIFDDRPILSPPLVCQLCDAGFICDNDFKHHMACDHGGENEYRKRVLYLMAEAGHRPITGQEKRIMVRNFAHFQRWCFFWVQGQLLRRLQSRAQS